MSLGRCKNRTLDAEGIKKLPVACCVFVYDRYTVCLKCQDERLVDRMISQSGPDSKHRYLITGGSSMEVSESGRCCEEGTLMDDKCLMEMRTGGTSQKKNGCTNTYVYGRSQQAEARCKMRVYAR